MPKIKTVRRSKMSTRSSMSRLASPRPSVVHEDPEEDDVEELPPLSEAVAGSSLESPVQENGETYSSLSSEEPDSRLPFSADLALATNMLTNNGGSIGNPIHGLPYPMQNAFGSGAGGIWPMPQIPQMGSFSGHQPNRTAGVIANELYGHDIKIDSAFCKKLANEVALREPDQRRPDATLNMERRSNVEAFLGHLTGVPVARACKNCHKGHGPWTECVIYDGQMCGSCTNCWFNASGSRCTFHESNHPDSIYAPSPLYNLPSAGMPQQAQQMAHSLSFLSQATSSLPQASSSFPLPSPPVQQLSPPHAAPIQDRFLARIEAAAEELGMRISEYDDYLKTPEGMVEEQRAQDEARSASTDESMEDAPSEESQPQ
ncbi:hypothetical protein FZEAL_6105 [Fusarium zealandicum]|uniref:Uncharacterized protein n=1 Tax=Fusarium zealandicum TaxID=1053134 RepID=A0A8H4UIE4_9HYPO|nr:hypothetical protein FZEAL_6105 [Fusarium zealandicum]